MAHAVTVRVLNVPTPTVTRDLWVGFFKGHIQNDPCLSFLMPGARCEGTVTTYVRSRRVDVAPGSRIEPATLKLK